MRLIDADALVNAHVDCPEHISFFDFGEIVDLFLKKVDEQPTVLKELIRCRECYRYDELSGCCKEWEYVSVDENGFCFKAERKETENAHS
jgi:hypothetical protein